MQHGLSVDDTVDEWVAFMENQQSPEITEDVVYKFESKVCMNVYVIIYLACQYGMKPCCSTGIRFTVEGVACR